ncbi:MAG: hypothetical protein ACOYOO_02535 [Saprospiraceae bacterium]
MIHDTPPGLSLEEILVLAPGPLTFERARLLLSKNKWPSLGWNGQVIWGECRSSGSLRYKVAADLSTRHFFSNSPATAKPDKYIVALLLKWYEGPEGFGKSGPAPDWVVAALEHTGGALPKVPKSGADTNTATREKRVAAMMEGAEGLRHWLLDVARNGLATLQMQDAQAWEAIAARLTDYKLAGLARRIRAMQRAATYSQWPEIFAEHIAALTLWAAAFGRFEELPSALQEELLIQGGQNARKEEALQSPPLEDEWFVFHSAHQEEGQLNIRRTWLWGQSHGIPALLLEYTWGSENFVQEWKAGEVFSGKIYYYPGATRLRALAGEGSSAKGQGFPQQGQCASATAMVRQFAHIVADNPWIPVFPFLLSPVTCVVYAGTPCLLDRENRVIPLDVPVTDGLTLLGLGCEGPLQVFGLWNGKRFSPLGAQRPGTAIFLFF